MILLYLPEPEVMVEVVVHLNLFLARNVQLFHGAGARHLYIRFYLFINAADHILEDVVVGEPEVDEKDGRHDEITRQESGEVCKDGPFSSVLVVYLETNDLPDIDDEEDHRNQTVVNAELCERAGKCSYKCKPVTIVDVTGDVEGHGKSRRTHPHDEKACEIDFVEILRIEEKIGDTQIFPEGAGDHCQKDDPAQQQHMIALYVVQKQLNRKGVSNNRKKGIDPSHGQFIKVTHFYRGLQT
jgi:hypothetical protein